MHLLCECVYQGNTVQHCPATSLEKRLSCSISPAMSLTTEVQQLCSTQNRSGQEWPTEIRKKKTTTDIWTHRNYLKGGYREDVVTLFSGKGWGLIDTRRNVSITCKENITWLIWPAMGARAQRSCGLSILGGNANTAGWGPEQNRELQSRPCFELGNAVHDLQRSFLTYIILWC